MVNLKILLLFGRVKQASPKRRFVHIRIVGVLGEFQHNDYYLYWRNSCQYEDLPIWHKSHCQLLILATTRSISLTAMLYICLYTSVKVIDLLNRHTLEHLLWLCIRESKGFTSTFCLWVTKSILFTGYISKQSTLAHSPQLLVLNICKGVNIFLHRHRV